jgi:uncharacterized protein
MLIDSLTFSRNKQDRRGALAIAGFDRLRESLFAVPRAGDANGDVSYEVSGGMDAQERPVLRLTVTGQLRLQCQRCLKALDYDLAIDTTLRLVPEVALDVEMSDDPDEPDCIAASAELDLIALIEDEILMALPAYPRHEGQERGGCNTMAMEGKAGTNKVSAFSALSDLSESGALTKRKAFKLKE